jgi:hypothetical protein
MNSLADTLRAENETGKPHSVRCSVIVVFMTNAQPFRPQVNRSEDEASGGASSTPNNNKGETQGKDSLSQAIPPGKNNARPNAGASNSEAPVISPLRKRPILSRECKRRDAAQDSQEVPAAAAKRVCVEQSGKVTLQRALEGVEKLEGGEKRVPVSGALKGQLQVEVRPPPGEKQARQFEKRLAEVRNTVSAAEEQGLRTYQVNMRIYPEGVELITCFPLGKFFKG